jgi:hypothetical protein
LRLGSRKRCAMLAFMIRAGKLFCKRVVAGLEKGAGAMQNVLTFKGFTT